MNKIIIYYWHLSKFPDVNLEHLQEFDYSKKKLHELVDYILGTGYSLMIRPTDKDLVIYIDKDRFKQK